MSIGPTLYEAITPPEVWITLHGLDHPDSDDRRVTIRVRPVGRKSVSAYVTLSKYSPETSILNALRHVIADCEVLQGRITRPMLKKSLDDRCRQYVEPF